MTKEEEEYLKAFEKALKEGNVRDVLDVDALLEAMERGARRRRMLKQMLN